VESEINMPSDSHVESKSDVADQVDEQNPAKQPSTTSFLGRLLDTARLTRKEAYRRKLKSVDLREAEYQIGRKAYDTRLVPTELSSLAGDLDQITVRIAAVQQRKDEKPASTFSAKAEAAAATAANKGKAERLRLKQSNLLKDLGARLRQHPAPAPALAAEIAAAASVQNRIKALDQEIETLRRSSWVKRPLLAVVSVLVVGLLLVTAVARRVGSRQQLQHKPDLARQHAMIEKAEQQAAAMQQQTDEEIAKRRQAEVNRLQGYMAETQKSQDDYLEKQAKQQAAREQAEREKANLKADLQRQMAQKEEESRKQAEEEQRSKFSQVQQKAQESTNKRQQIVATIVRTKAKIEEAELAPAGSSVKYKVSPHAIHLAAATLKGSRPMMVIDGVAGPTFDELIRPGDNAFQAPGQMTFRPDPKDTTSSDNAPIIFSDDGNRFAYIGRQGNQFVLIVDGEEFARGTYSPSAIQSLSFTPGGKHLRYVENLPTPQGEITRLVVDGKKDPPTAGLNLHYLSWSPDGEHWAYFRSVPGYRTELRPSPHLVVDGKENPPALNAQGYDIRPNTPLFTGDSAHLITIRQRRQIAASGGPVSDKFGPETVFVDGKAVLEAPSPLYEGHNVPAQFKELSVAPQGDNFVAVFRLHSNPHRVYFNQHRLTPDVRDVGHIGWSADGKRCAVACETDHESRFLFLDGKAQPEYRGLSTRGDLSTGSLFYPFTADSSQCVYIARTDKNFVVANDQESDGYRQVENLTFSEKGSHFAFVAMDDDNNKILVVDGAALPPRKDVHDFAFTTDGSHYSCLSGDAQKPHGNGVIVDGVEQTADYGTDLVHYGTSSREENRQCVVSPDGKHVLYLGNWPAKTEHSPNKAVCLDGKLIPCEAEHSEVAAFFTPDSKHVVWIDWGGKLNDAGPASWDKYNDVPGFSVYVDGQLDAHFDCPSVHEPNTYTSTARFFRDNKSASEMGADGSLTIIAQVGNVIKKLRITPSPKTSLARFAALSEEQTAAVQESGTPNQ
jgi:hypothetical protein